MTATKVTKAKPPRVRPRGRGLERPTKQRPVPRNV
jgi:hypothetical protein